MTFFISFIFILVSSFSFLASPALAQCPVCVVTVGGGMLIARKLGVDDLLVSIWIAALNVAISFWLASGMKDKALRPKFLHNPWIFSFIMLISTVAYFQFTDQIGHPSNQVLGIDKIILGQIFGSLTMIGGNSFYQLTKKRLGHTPFPYAKVVFPFVSVLIITLVFKFVFSL